MRTNQVRQIGTLLLQSFEKQSGVAEFVFIGRVLEQLESFRIGGFFVGGALLEVETLERFLVGEEELVVEGELGVERMSQHDVAELVSQNHGQRSLIGKHIEQAPADHDRVTYRK